MPLIMADRLLNGISNNSNHFTNYGRMVFLICFIEIIFPFDLQISEI